MEPIRKNLVLQRAMLRILATSVAAATPVYAHAADAVAVDSLDEIVITASAGDKSLLRSSISVTDVTTQAIQDFTPRSEGSVLRMIPGIQIGDTAGPGGNSNIGVRGIPVSTGGSEYVQIQEDGLPVVLFGDIQFGNNDYWIRFDQNVERVEAVRGGSASTYASQAPGAVINYISKTGEVEGGSVGITRGTNYRETRLDFDYGEHVSDTVRFHVGGFIKDGGGPTNLDYNAASGYQIKGNITKDLDEGKGFIRLNFKRLDDKEPTNTSMPQLANLSGSNVSSIGQLPGLDPRYYSSAGIYNQQFLVDQNGVQRLVGMDGIHPEATAFGGQFHYEFDHNIAVNDNFRYTIMRGVFANQWTTEGLTANVLGCPVGYAGCDPTNPLSLGKGKFLPANTPIVGSIVNAAGLNSGQNYASPYINNGAQAYTTMTDMGSTVNDLSFTGKFDWSGDVTSNAKLGWFHDRQAIAGNWLINNAYTSLNSTSNSVPLDLFTGPNGTGTQLTANGLSGFNNQWGGCCGGRSYDLSYTDDAVYLDFDTKVGKLDLDPSVRIDNVRGNGTSYAPTAGPNVTLADGLTKSGAGAVLPTYVTSASPNDVVNYTRSYTSWSFGALYEITSDMSVFARASRGGRFNADRMMYSGDFNADGSLNSRGASVALNFLNQQEVGIKDRGNWGSSRYSIEATIFHTSLTEHNYDFTLLSKNPPQDPNISAQYRGQGLEFTGSLSNGPFNVVVDLTYSDSKIEANPVDPASVGKQPNSLPSLLYRISPAYDAGLYAVGLNITGHGSSYSDNDNTVSLPGSTFVSLFAKVRPYKNLEAGLNISNLFNTIGTAGGGSIQQKLSAGQAILDGSIPYGRLVDVSVRYKF